MKSYMLAARWPNIIQFPVPFYLASKLEALHSRGGEDCRGAKDFEDIVYVLNYCPDLIQ